MDNYNKSLKVLQSKYCGVDLPLPSESPPDSSPIPAPNYTPKPVKTKSKQRVPKNSAPEITTIQSSLRQESKVNTSNNESLDSLANTIGYGTTGID